MPKKEQPADINGHFSNVKDECLGCKNFATEGCPFLQSVVEKSSLPKEKVIAAAKQIQAERGPQILSGCDND